MGYSPFDQLDWIAFGCGHRMAAPCESAEGFSGNENGVISVPIIAWEMRGIVAVRKRTAYNVSEARLRAQRS
jgi:hypothetical protein